MAMPIFDPDSGDFASLRDALANDRVLRRLKLPGQFEYALNQSDIQGIELLIDVPPAAASARMKILQNSLLSDERMVLYQDLEETKTKLLRAAPDATVRLWQVPLMAQVQAQSVRNRLQSITPFTLSYLAMHGVWMMENPASEGRLHHLNGQFESTLDEKGALRLYMDTRVAEELISDLAMDPTVQDKLGLKRSPGEPMETYQMRIEQMQFILRKSKIDTSFLLAQLHFDRGNLNEAKNFFERGLRSEPSMIGAWLPVAHYGLARIGELDRDLEKAAEELTFQPNPQEAGNRMRLRYLRRMLEPESAAAQ
jgi:tetratricopeptide (TPR) repeat protein